MSNQSGPVGCCAWTWWEERGTITIYRTCTGTCSWMAQTEN